MWYFDVFTQNPGFGRGPNAGGCLPHGWVPCHPWDGCLYHHGGGACTTHGRVPNHCFGCQIHCFLSQKSAKIHCFRSQNTPFSGPKYTVFGSPNTPFSGPNTVFSDPNTVFSDPNTVFYRVFGPKYRVLPCFRVPYAKIPCFRSHMPKYRVLAKIPVLTKIPEKNRILAKIRVWGTRAGCLMPYTGCRAGCVSLVHRMPWVHRVRARRCHHLVHLSTAVEDPRCVFTRLLCLLWSMSLYKGSGNV